MLAITTAGSPSWARATTQAVATVATDSAPAEDERVESLYLEGRQDYDAGSYATAIVLFEEAYAISADKNLLYNISLCYDRLGEFSRALEYLDRYATDNPTADLELVERKRSSLRLRAARERESDSSETTAPRGTDEARGAAEDDKSPPVVSPAAAAMLGVGGAGFAVALGTGIASLQADRSAQCEAGGPGTLCTEGGRADAKKSRTLALATDVAMGIGAAALVAAVVIISVRGARRAKMRRASASFSASGTQALVRVGGRF